MTTNVLPSQSTNIANDKEMPSVSTSKKHNPPPSEIIEQSSTVDVPVENAATQLLEMKVNAVPDEITSTIINPSTPQTNKAPVTIDLTGDDSETDDVSPHVTDVPVSTPSETVATNVSSAAAKTSSTSKPKSYRCCTEKYL